MMLSTILMWIGAIVCIIGAVTVITTGLFFVRDWVLTTFYEWKLDRFEKALKYNTMQLAAIHLHKLKKKYPELEISFNEHLIDE